MVFFIKSTCLLATGVLGHRLECCLYYNIAEAKLNPQIKICAKRHIRPLYVNFGGDVSFVFGLVLSVAQISLASYHFLCFPAAAYVHLDT